MWKRYEKGTAQGTHVQGDASTPPTRWWNHWYLALWGWKIVTVFEVSADDAAQGYQVGYLPFDGDPKVEGKLNHSRRFRMKNGHEDCTFFAVTIDGQEVPLTVIARTDIQDTKYHDAPLH